MPPKGSRKVKIGERKIVAVRAKGPSRPRAGVIATPPRPAGNIYAPGAQTISSVGTAGPVMAGGSFFGDMFPNKQKRAENAARQQATFNRVVTAFKGGSMPARIPKSMIGGSAAPAGAVMIGTGPNGGPVYMHGGSFFGDVGRWIKNAAIDTGRFLKNTKVISRVASLIPHPAAQTVGTVAGQLGLGQMGGAARQPQLVGHRTKVVF